MKGQNGTGCFGKAVSKTKDREILALFRARDERALSETSKAYSGMCMRLAINILGSRLDAEEVVSDVLMQLWQSVPPAEPQNLEAYLVTLTRRTALKYLENRNAKKRGGGKGAAVLDELERDLCAKDNVEAIYDSRELQEAVNRFLRSLPAEQKKMFLQRYWYFCTTREIAEDMHLKESNVRVTLMRLRSRLKEQLHREGFL